MALREFTAADGEVWQVWDTVPGTPHEAAIFAQSARFEAEAARRGEGLAGAAGRLGVSRGRGSGWLTFQCGQRKRRLSPIPGAWEAASPTQLAEWLGLAEPVHLSPAAARLLGQALGEGDGR